MMLMGMSFNRTSVELKHNQTAENERAHLPFNRTSVELKLNEIIDGELSDGHF